MAAGRRRKAWDEIWEREKMGDATRQGFNIISKISKKLALMTDISNMTRISSPAPQEEDRTANQRSGSKITVVKTIAGHLCCMTINRTMKYFQLNLIKTLILSWPPNLSKSIGVVVVATLHRTAVSQPRVYQHLPGTINNIQQLLGPFSDYQHLSAPSWDHQPPSPSFNDIQ